MSARPDLGLVSVLRESLSLARAASWKGGLYVVCVQALGAIALAPLATWLFYEGLNLSGAPAAANSELVDVVLDWRALPARLLWMVVAGVVFCFLSGGTALVVTSVRHGRPLTVRDTLTRTAGALPRMLDRGLLKLGAFVAVLVPVTAVAWSALLAILYAPFEKSLVLRLFPDDPRLLLGVGLAALVLVAVGFVLYVRWGFTVQLLVVDRLPLGQAFARSAELSTARMRPFALARAALLLGVVAAFSAASGLYAGLSALVLAGSEGLGTWGIGFAAVMVALQVGTFAVLELIAEVWNAAMTVVLQERLLGTGTDAGPAAAPEERPLNRRLIAAAVLAFMVVATALSVPRIRAELERAERPVLVIAHRGSSGHAPENTLAAFRAALEDGADYIELDVQEAADGELVVLHDLTLQRVAGRPEGAWQLDSGELAGIDIGSWFDPSFAGEGVPTLVEVIDAVRGRARLMIEVKLHGEERDVVGALLAVLERESFGADCFVASLDRQLLEEVRRRAPELELGLILSASVGDPLSIDVEHLCVQPLLATSDFVVGANDRDRAVHAWTLNEAADLTRFVDRGVDGVITDEPALALRLLEERTPADDVRAALSRLFGQ